MANVNWFYISPRGSSGQTGTGLKGEYFNNMDFTAPVLTRTDPTVNFNWGTGSPDPRIDPDTFSVRWSGEIKFPATGTYTFYTTTDDGVRLTVNGQRIIDHLTPQAATMYSATIDIAGADSPRVPIVMEYFERSGGALAKLEWSGPGIVGRQVIPASQLYPVGDTSSDNQAPSAVPNFRVFTTSDHEIALAWDHATDNVGVDGYQLWIDNSAPVTLGPQIGTYTFSNLQAGSTHTFSIRAFDVARNFGPTSTVQATTTGGTTGEHGFHADYFNNMNFDFNGYAFSRTDATIDFNWGTGSPGASMDPDTFSVRWIGQLKAPTTGRYTFYTTTDDGVRLWVNGQLLIDHLTPQPATEWSGSIDLLAGGIYDIRMDYFERYGSAQAKLQWSGPGINKQVIPQSQVTTGSGSGDIQAPGPVPTFEAARITQNEIDVQWTPAFDDVGVAGYVLRQDDANPIVVGPDVRTFAYRNLQPSTPYRLTINAFDAAGNQGPRTTITVTTDAAQTSNGLTGTYFNNMDFTAPVFTRIDPKIDFNWAGNSPDADRIGPDTFSVRWTGYIVAPTTGRYTFYTTTDDGARLTINGQRIIDKLVPQAATEWSGSIDLVAGQKYSLNMEYFERFGMALARLQWAGPGISKQVVPQSNLSSS
ncbi:MAG TPA: PA14 domain-containing protein [Tepidisphaeraceae bacterium]|jgi:hypothetical protein|nr:PA14 domain-containing protein [Tepidisphaeraceae bacterium]